MKAQTANYSVTVPAAQAAWLLDSAGAWGVGMQTAPVRADGTRVVEFNARTRAHLAALPPDCDGVIDGDQMWIGGTGYAVQAR